MNNKIQRFIEPNMRFYLVIMLIFAVAALFFDVRLAEAEFAIMILLVIYSAVVARKKRRELVEYIDSITYDVQSAKNDTLLNFPLPMVVFKLDDKQIIWGNQVFFNICGGKTPSFEARLTDLVPDFSDKWLKEGKSQCPGIITVGDRKYQIHGNIVRSAKNDGAHGFMGITYWVDVTEYDNIRIEFQSSRPIVAIIALDNIDELAKNLSERAKSDIRGQLDDKIIQWTDGKNGVVRRVDRDRYFFIFETRYLEEIISDKFSLLEEVRKIISPNGIHATVSIGIGRDGANLEENYHFAALSTEMALSRGGDQAVIKNRFTFEFFGGKGTEIETRTKVRSRVMANALNEMIADASQVFVMGHKHADLDSIGAAAGICCMARKHGKTSKIVVDPEKNAAKGLIDKLKEHPEYKDTFITPHEAIVMADSRCLLVVVDTNRPEQVEDQNFLMACNRVVVIDHHRRAATYIENPVLTLYEPYASSVCELMAELLQEVVEQSDILNFEAEAILAGIVLDTKSFTIRTGERTFDAAAFLRRAGADTVGVKRLLQSDFAGTVERYTILQSARIYRESIAISAMTTPQDRIIAAQAADELLNISGVEVSIVLFPTDDGGVNISARSIGNINVQVLLEQLGGGGNNSAAGAQMKNISIRDAVKKLFVAIDKYLDE
ncbi:MAG: DHH family phosphoesterase [Oscillospiraceae bacterium]